jgi:hypothetical protein
LCEHLNQHVLKDERIRKLHHDYEKYIHTVIQHKRVRCSDFEFWLVADEEDQITFTLHEIESPHCTVTKAIKLCNWWIGFEVLGR